MYGFPRRTTPPHQPPTPATLYDPSGDASCVGWWRADRGVTVGDNGEMSAWRNQIAPYQQLTSEGGSIFPVYLSRFTHRWPAILWMKSCNTFTAGSLFQDNDTAFTLTYVVRWPTTANNNYAVHIVIYDPPANSAVQMGIWDNWLRAHVNGYWRDFYNGMFYPCGTVAGVAVITIQKWEADGGIHIDTTYNGTHKPGFVSGLVNIQMASTILRLQPESYRGTYFHEVILHRRKLSDLEVATAHTNLLNQYAAM